jgi:hypothetical protein
MSNNSNFIKKANESSSFLSESKILSQISNIGKSVIISVENLLYFQEHYELIKRLIEKVKISNFSWITINNDGTYTEKNLGNPTEINQVTIINIINEELKNYKGQSFVVNNGIKFLYSDGKINEEVDSCLEKNKSMQERLKVLHPVSELNEVFEHFKVNCKHQKKYYDKCFSHHKIIKKEIKEQELRNILMKYLQKNMQGEVSIEFCTDYLNDEESVDIYLNDGKQRAIIEVKFSFEEKYYEGKTFYKPIKKIEQGIEQLNKYAIHLAKDTRLVDYGYVYMFYITDMEETEIDKKIDDKVRELEKIFSKDLASIFEGVKTNNMKVWGIDCKKI